MRVPDFFIIGAPKCGTTALHSYLREHPRIFMPERKEVHYFCHDLNFSPRSAIRDRNAYLRLFAAASSDALIGESSASYLYSEVAVAEILQANPDAKFIAMLRNPVDMAYSFHSQLLANLNEDVCDFEAAWQLQSRRIDGQNLPGACAEPKFLQYKAVCSFSDQICRLMQRAVKDSIYICIYEDFARETKKAYESILQFLELPSDGRDTFSVVNSNRVYRSARLNRLLRRPPRALDRIYLPLKRCANILGFRPRAMLERFNVRRMPRPALDRLFRAHLAAEFARDIERLEGILGRSLDVWKLQTDASPRV